MEKSGFDEMSQYEQEQYENYYKGIIEGSDEEKEDFLRGLTNGETFRPDELNDKWLPDIIKSISDENRRIEWMNALPGEYSVVASIMEEILLTLSGPKLQEILDSYKESDDENATFIITDSAFMKKAEAIIEGEKELEDMPIERLEKIAADNDAKIQKNRATIDEKKKQEEARRKELIEQIKEQRETIKTQEDEINRLQPEQRKESEEK